MSKVILALGAVTLSLCFALPLPVVRAISEKNTSKPTTVPVDVVDSDEFYQRAMKSGGTERDNTQKIEALIKQMTLEEKVGQMTQLTIGMIVNGPKEIWILQNHGRGFVVEIFFNRRPVHLPMHDRRFHKFDVQIVGIGAQNSPVNRAHPAVHNNAIAAGNANGHHRGFIQRGAAVIE